MYQNPNKSLTSPESPFGTFFTTTFIKKPPLPFKQTKITKCRKYRKLNYRKYLQRTYETENSAEREREQRKSGRSCDLAHTQVLQSASPFP